MSYYDLPKGQIQVSEEEALFDRLLDDNPDWATWLLDARRAGFSLTEARVMLRSVRHPTRGV